MEFPLVARSPSRRRRAASCDRRPSRGSFARLTANRQGAVYTEYLVLLAILALGLIGAVRALAGSIWKAADRTGNHVAALLAWSGASQGGPWDVLGASEPATPVSRETVAAQRGQPPAAVHHWWNGLTAAQREQAIRDYPDLVGWLDGVPAVDRDRANRIRLDSDLDAARTRQRELEQRIQQLQSSANRRTPTITSASELARLQQQLGEVRDTIDGLEQVQGRLDALGPRGFLLGVDPAGDGKAIVAVGNPDLAEHTAVWVPGLNTTLQSTNGNVARVQHLQELSERLRTDGDDVSTIMWLGYDAPELTNVAGEGRSKEGSGPLASFVGGLRATHAPGDEHVTAIGHSYGSTVVAEAALQGGFAVDDIVVAGSPGLHTDHASDLMDDPNHVWIGAANDDPVANPSGHSKYYGVLGPLPGWVLARAEEDLHGPSPQHSDFGANRYHVDTSGHTDYWNPDTESLRNQANIVAGLYGRVDVEHGQAPTDVP